MFQYAHKLTKPMVPNKHAGFGEKPIRAIIVASLLVAAIEFTLAALSTWLPFSTLLACVMAVLSVPGLVGFVLMLNVVARNELVPGAMDDLSGVAALLLLARRFTSAAAALPLPRDVELVFVVTGCEEVTFDLLRLVLCLSCS